MTTGQRVAQKRKELGLSQEALGEKLGVSRQSIYKWESDSALPEVEKLVALSRLFGVSVGWLLGVEEGAAPSGGELTAEQLALVEKIAARYAPKPRLSPRRLAAVKVSAAAAALCLCLVLWGFYRKMDRLNQHYYFLQADITEVQRSVDERINSVSNRMETLFREQNAVTADYGTCLVDVDLSASSAIFRVYAVPKNYTEGMRAEFYEANGSPCQVLTVREGPGQRFEADLECGLMEELSLCADFIYPDGSRQTQILDHYEGLYGQTFPNVRAETCGRQGTASCCPATAFRSASIWTTALHPRRAGSLWQRSNPRGSGCSRTGSWWIGPSFKPCRARWRRRPAPSPGRSGRPWTRSGTTAEAGPRAIRFSPCPSRRGRRRWSRGTFWRRRWLYGTFTAVRRCGPGRLTGWTGRRAC